MMPTEASFRDFKSRLMELAWKNMTRTTLSFEIARLD